MTSNLGRNYQKRVFYTYAIAVISAAILLFWYVFGWGILNPLHTSWLLSGDASIYFFGFNFFNQESWHLPPGSISRYSFPEGTSVVYTDSIPLVSIFLKLFHLSSIFQFTGAWILLCLILQALVAYLILYRISKSAILSSLASLFFLMMPNMLERFYFTTRHYSLIAHFLILLTIGLFLDQRLKKKQILWFILFLLTLGIHFYLFFISLLFYVASEFVTIDQIKPKIQHLIMGTGLVIYTYLLGYFTIPLQNSTAGGFGSYSMNLNSVFNSMGEAKFFPALSTIHSLQQEGFQYLGLGVILLILLVALGKCKFSKIPLFSKNPLVSVKSDSTLALVLIFFTLLSLSFKLSVFQWIIPEPFTIPSYFGIFYFWFLRAGSKPLKAFMHGLVCVVLLFIAGKVVRATGRFLWPVEYFALFLIFQAKPKPWLVAALLLVQVADLKPLLDSIHAEHAALSAFKQPELSPHWPLLIKDIQHIALYDPNSINVNPFSKMALEHGQSIGPMLVARASSSFRKEEQKALHDEIINLAIKNNILYLVGDQKLWDLFKENCAKNLGLCNTFQFGELDGYRYLKRNELGSR